MKNKIATRSPASLDSQLRLKYGVAITDVSLDVPQTLTDEEIVDVGRQVKMLNHASAWWIADYILFCQKAFLETGKGRRAVYDRIAELWPQYARSTLKDFATVARRVPIEIRSARLSFEHHSHIATLFEESQGRDLQKHYIKVAENTEATADQLRLMISDTRKGIQFKKAARPAKHATIDIKATAGGKGEDHRSDEKKEGDGLPIPRETEPEILAGGHAQLVSDAQRSCVRLREWYSSQGRKTKIEDWTDARKRALVNDLKPLLAEMHHVADLFGALTNAEQTGDYDGDQT